MIMAAHLHLAVIKVGSARFILDVLTALAQGPVEDSDCTWA
jgi:hypothetical protein